MQTLLGVNRFHVMPMLPMRLAPLPVASRAWMVGRPPQK
jgi:hypothetical protein